ncbi:accessory gene regulator AgrB [Staphylococcus coagulans]|uniref:Accessory gene regulator protein B n=1 Tax=Staphylococcus coagulans TaxID=74706 RepID=A0A9X0PI54_9STAP|nr:accessory gene regulator AgrB [Staphylococcus coagulans]MBA8772890.1 accessory gene regulator AgrB [Staphylococcus coagulans]MBA8777408.1 accessory gene regulator AgrB [Staphylococcus coagulans]UNB49345.1 accessory gene regulator AgrB [Staphylococcus coagulans]
MQIIDNSINKFARKLQEKQNLDHLDFLRVRLGIQLVVMNLSKAIVTYGLALLVNTFLYTLIAHLSFVLLKQVSYGAHAKNSLLCHVQNILFFIAVPWLIVKYEIPYAFMLLLSLLGWLIVVKYAPAATRKLPIKSSRKKELKIKSVVVMTLLIGISLFIPSPFQQLITYAITVQSLSLLPIFFPKEDIQ